MQAAVLVSRLRELEEQIGRISRHYERAGAGALRLVDTGRREGPMAIVALEAEPERLGDWEIVCVLHHREGEQPMLEACVPLAPRDRERLLDARALCEACRTVRPRAQTLLLREQASGRTIQLGTSCARTYTGSERPELAIRRAQAIAQARQAILTASNDRREGDEYIDLETFLAHTVAVVREHGWAGATGPQPTWREALNRVEQKLQGAAGDRLRVAEIREWTRALASSEPAGYTLRMSGCLASDRLTTRELALAASAVRAYNRHLYWEIRRRKRSESVTGASCES